VAGVADFVGKGLSINLVGADKVLTATDGGLTQATTAAFTITHAAAAKLILTTPPSASTAPTVAFAQQPIVTIQDAFNNTVTSDSASVITAALTTGTGTLAGTVTKTAASGIADFAGNNLAINLVGADKVLTFTSGGLTQAVSAAFTIAAPVASAATSTITAAPTEILGNGAEASTITVQLKDGGSANLSAGGDTVTLSTDLGTLSAVTDNGDGTYTATLTSLVTGPATVTGTVNTVAITATAAVTVNAISLPPAAPTADEPGVEVVLDPATTEPVSTTEEVALSTTSTDGSTATITVPPAALPDGATVEVAGVADVADLAAQTAPPAGVGLLLGFSITAADAAGTAVTSGFSSPVALEFTVDASSLPSGAGAGELRTAFWNGTAWVPLDSVVTINADGSATISADTDHFSLYSVIHDAEGFGRIAGQVPATGVGFVTFGGSVAELQTAMIAAGCSNPAFVTSNGAWVSYLPDGPFAAINADFEALFAEGVPLGRALIVSNCG
jgi:adhesin/invasin